MTNSNEFKKVFEPKSVKNPYIGILLMLILIAFGFDFIFFGYNQKPLKEYLLFSSVILVAILFMSYLIYGTFAFSLYITLTDTSLIGRNKFKFIKGEINLKEIEEIYVISRSYILQVKDIYGKILKISVLPDYAEPLLNEIIQRAVNCKKIDILYLKKRYPHIIKYEKGK